MVLAYVSKKVHPAFFPLSPRLGALTALLFLTDTRDFGLG